MFKNQLRNKLFRTQSIFSKNKITLNFQEVSSGLTMPTMKWSYYINGFSICF